jgi:acetyltransferase-like isoleucine patch superfamily enzyme
MTERAVTVDEALAIASAQRRAGHLDEAESILRQILEARPSHPTGWHELALALNASGRHSEALDAVAAAIDADPASADLHATRGEVLAALGRPEEAVAAFRLAVGNGGRSAAAEPPRPQFSPERLRDALVVAANEVAAGLGARAGTLTFHDLMQLPRVWKYKMLSDCERVTGTPITAQPVLLKGPGEIRLGRDVQFGWHASPGHYSGYAYVEAGLPESVVEIGDGALFNNNATVRSEGPGIRIGEQALFGTNVEVFDSDFHELDPARRRGGSPNTAHVDIGANVFVGSDVKILKGVTIGANTVVGNGAIVTASLPADVIAVGSPARVLRSL